MRELHRCSRWTHLKADRWADDVRLSDIEPKSSSVLLAATAAPPWWIGGRQSE